MKNEEFNSNFWLGNAILALALLMLLYMGTLWENLGILALLIWAVLAGIGAYLLMQKPGPRT